VYLADRKVKTALSNSSEAPLTPLPRNGRFCEEYVPEELMHNRKTEGKPRELDGGTRIGLARWFVKIPEVFQVSGEPDLPFVTGAVLAVLLSRYLFQEEISFEIQVLINDGPSATAIAEPLPVNAVVNRTIQFQHLVGQVRDALGDFTEFKKTRNDAVDLTIKFVATRELTRVLVGLDEDEGEWLALGATLSYSHSVPAVSFDYPLELSGSELISQMARHFQSIFAEGAVSQFVCVAKLQFLTDGERRRVLVEWNDTSCPSSDQSIPDLFAKQANRTPLDCALIYGDEHFTYRELNEQANRIAWYLRRCGVTQGMLVGWCFENSPLGVGAVLGILKAGAAYVPLDPNHPRSRLEEIVDDSGLSIIVTDGNCRDKVSFGTTMLIDLDEAADSIANEHCADCSSGSTADSVAYVVYTSGSTGPPNGVIGIHRSVVNGLNETLFEIGRQGEVSCLNGPMSVALQILGLFLPLLCGVPLVILSSEQFTDPVLLADIILRERITTIALPTPSLRQMLFMGSRITSRLETLRLVMVGGANVTPDLVTAFGEQLPNVLLIKGYGSSEIGSIATKGPAQANNSVGRPIANTQIYILDSDLNPVGPGMYGELYVGAAHLARAYLNRPDLTASRFVDDPFSDRPGRRLFKTGDLGRFRMDGEVEFLGRSDDQVKIRGFRVHLSEVESALVGHPAIQEAVVVVREVDARQRLLAYVIARPIAAKRIRPLREYLKERLPEHMVPSAFCFLDIFPMTRSGKVDRNRLPFPLPNRSVVESEYEAPRNPVEAFLVDVWQNLLEVERIGVNDDFEELGGDSLLAVQVVTQIWDRYSLELPLNSVFERATVAQLAKEITDPI
jgi:amino acid adenylation domain-containing protein